MSSPIDPLGFAREEIERLRVENLLRRTRGMETMAGSEVVVEGERLINFSSNNYLGLAEHPAVTAAAADAAIKWGAGATASRLIIGSNTLVEKLEARLAQWRGTEAALVFPTGFQTNLGTVGALVGKGDTVIADKLCHASLIDAARLSGAALRTHLHGDLNQLESLLKKPRTGRTLVLADGIYSMDGDLCDLPALLEITARHGALLLVDDAHAVGLFGESGSGTREHFGLAAPRHLIQTATLSKAFGSQGGFLCGPRVLIDLIVNRARAFIFATGLAPAAAGAALAGLGVIEEEPERRERLWANRACAVKGLSELGWDVSVSDSPILPLITGSAESALQLADHLRQLGILGVAIRPPTVPRRTSRVRLTVMATHTEEQMGRLLAAMEAWEREG